MSSVKHVSNSTFAAEVLQSPVPVLVDFYANWCGPCRLLAPTLERLAVEFGGRVRIAKVNIDADPQLADQFQVESIPTLVFVSGGKIVGRTSGLVPEVSLRQALQQLTGTSPGTSRRVG